MPYTEKIIIQYVNLKGHCAEKTRTQQKLTDQELSRGDCNTQGLWVIEDTIFTFFKKEKRK